MFITLTIDTTRKTKNKVVKMQKNRFDASKGWRKKIHTKKRSVVQKVQAWRRSLRTPQYKLDGQVAMF